MTSPPQLKWTRALLPWKPQAGQARTEGKQHAGIYTSSWVWPRGPLFLCGCVVTVLLLLPLTSPAPFESDLLSSPQLATHYTPSLRSPHNLSPQPPPQSSSVHPQHDAFSRPTGSSANCSCSTCPSTCRSRSPSSYDHPITNPPRPNSLSSRPTRPPQLHKGPRYLPR